MSREERRIRDYIGKDKNLPDALHIRIPRNKFPVVLDVVDGENTFERPVFDNPRDKVPRLRFSKVEELFQWILKKAYLAR